MLQFVVEVAGPGSQGWWGEGRLSTLGLSRAPGLCLRLHHSLLPGLLLAPGCLSHWACVKEGGYSPWSVWPTASLADGQSPELTRKEHKQGP